MSRIKPRLRKSFEDIQSLLKRLPKWAWPLVGLLLAALLAVGTWLVAEVWPETEDLTWQRILETGVIRVCTDPSWPPFEFIDERSGEIKGLDVDLASALAARIGPTGTAIRAGCRNGACCSAGSCWWGLWWPVSGC